MKTGLFRFLPRVFQTAAVLLMAATAGGCFRQPVPELDGLPQRPEYDETATPQAGAEGRRFEVGQGRLLVRVYRSGSMARLGHNHTIEAPIHGVFSLLGSAVTAELFVRPAELVVDRQETRTSQGEDFAKPVKAADVEGTRGNLLSENVLNPLQHPFIRASIDSAVTGSGFTAVTFELAGKQFTRELEIQTLEDDPCNPRYAGELTLSHGDFGLQPFSILGGAIAVKDEFEVVFELTGVRQDMASAGCQALSLDSSRSQRLP